MVSAGDTSYGMNNNSSSSSSSSSSGDPQHYGGGGYSDSSTGTVDTGQSVPIMPTVPATSSDASGDVSVDTKALKQFADNLETISETVGSARERVVGLKPIAPGTFPEATALKAKISGGDGGGGLQDGLAVSMHDLRQALMDIADKIRTMANKYSTMEELNEKAGSELHQLMQSAQSDLQSFQQHSAAVGQAAGADSPPTSGSTTV
ncbi:hypothetical protein AB0A77_12145 [Streptomyces varsoviensis]|uniref:hypothetical protein n=1 Tax=Streptomyces varsoviensis TaxID=67373 RepID=UPI0033C866EB